MTNLRAIILCKHMPVFITTFFGLLIFILTRLSVRGIQSYLFFAWPLTVEMWLVVAAWKKRELVEDGFYVLYFWWFSCTLIGLALHILNRALNFMNSDKLVSLVIGISFVLLVLVLVAVSRRWLVKKKVEQNA